MLQNCKTKWIWETTESPWTNQLSCLTKKNRSAGTVNGKPNCVTGKAVVHPAGIWPGKGFGTGVQILSPTELAVGGTDTVHIFEKTIHENGTSIWKERDPALRLHDNATIKRFFASPNGDALLLRAGDGERADLFERVSGNTSTVTNPSWALVDTFREGEYAFASQVAMASFANELLISAERAYASGLKQSGAIYVYQRLDRIGSPDGSSPNNAFNQVQPTIHILRKRYVYIVCYCFLLRAALDIHF